MQPMLTLNVYVLSLTCIETVQFPPLNLIPNSKRERTVVVTILAEECALNLDLIPKVN
jgi:hypothetical protein